MINLKYKYLLKIAVAILTFGIALTMMVIDVNVLTRVFALLCAFFSGFGFCHAGYSLNWHREGETS